jgi:hypothetical protein
LSGPGAQFTDDHVIGGLVIAFDSHTSHRGLRAFNHPHHQVDAIAFIPTFVRSNLKEKVTVIHIQRRNIPTRRVHLKFGLD